MIRRVAAAFGVIGLLVVVPPGVSVAAGDCDLGVLCDDGVHVDDSIDAFVGRGGLLLPSSFAGDTVTRQDASSCPDCEWRLVPFCLMSQEQDVTCASAAEGCPTDQMRMRVMRRVPPDTAWTQTGVVCVGESSRPVTVEEAAQSVRDRFVDRLPVPQPTFQPARGGLTNLPVVFRSGQPGGVRVEDFRLVGMPVRVRAEPSWVWDFGDGTPELRTTSPGSTWPATEVSHVFTAPGRYDVTVHASWVGTFTVDGLGPFDVDGGAVTQDETVQVPVRDAPAELVVG